jgi:DivIVA domain-containing protein
MPDLETPADGDRSLDPDEVSDRSFPTAFRGFDPVQVRAFLGTVADELRRLRSVEAELRAALESGPSPAPAAEVEGAPAEASAPSPPSSSAAEADEVLEQAKAEADRLVREARERVATLGSAATAEASRVLEEARAEAARLRATATDDLKGRIDDAEASAVRKIAEAEREAAAIRVKAREEADATIEAARERGREMVAEAQAARERMLADLAKRKRAAQSQLEQLRAGRDRLLDTLKVARRSIDEMTARFDTGAGETGVGSPPSSGTPSGPVTTTPGLSSTEARPRPVGGRGAVVPPPSSEGAGEAPARAPRSRSVVIGEGPPPIAPRPSISATPAAAQAPEPPAPAPGPAPTEPSSEPEPMVAEIVPEPPPHQERRSSALRILRRNRGADAAPAVPPLIGRESSVEGVRIIGREPEPAPPPVADEPAEVQADTDVDLEALLAAEPPLPEERAAADEPEEVAAMADAALGASPAAAPDTGADAPIAPSPTDADADAGRTPLTDAADAGHTPVADRDADAEAAGGRTPVAAAADAGRALLADADASDAGGTALVEGPEPLAREEIRPRIEDLFARMRAEREAATASARQVLSDADTAPATEAEPEPEPEPVPAAEGAPSDARTSDEDEQLLQARDAVTEPLAAQLTKRLKRALQDEQNASLDRLRTSRGTVAVDHLLSPANDQRAPYQLVANPFLEQAARGGAAASQFGAVAVAIAVDDLAGQLAEDLAGALRTRLDTVLGAAASEGLDLGGIGERVSSVYREWKVQKIERLAIHYLVAAHERGAFLARPEGTPLRWIVDDEGPCPDCEDNALAGPTPRGEPFPTGQLHPPAHVGCRCLLAPAPH